MDETETETEAETETETEGVRHERRHEFDFGQARPSA